MRKTKLPFIMGILLGIGLFILALIVIYSFPDTKENSLPTAVLKITPYQPTATISSAEQTEITASTA